MSLLVLLEAGPQHIHLWVWVSQVVADGLLFGHSIGLRRRHCVQWTVTKPPIEETIIGKSRQSANKKWQRFDSTISQCMWKRLLAFQKLNWNKQNSNHWLRGARDVTHTVVSHNWSKGQMKPTDERMKRIFLTSCETTNRIKLIEHTINCNMLFSKMQVNCSNGSNGSKWACELNMTANDS